jgi:hypothetical protein
MKLFIAAVLFVFMQLPATSQKPKPEIEISPYFRMDWYPKFNYAYNSVSTNTVKIIGSNWGTAITYKIPTSRKATYRLGLGYYKYSFNRIKSHNTRSGKGKSRHVDDYSPPGGFTPSFPFTTDKYWYNTVSLDLGMEKKVGVDLGLEFNYGFEISNYFSFSQKYHIRFPNPSGVNHIRDEFRYFGLSAKLITGLRKKIGNVTIGPNIILPIFDNWRKDDMFTDEKKSESRSKWSQGVAVGFSCAFQL